jgi:predicted transglutaminase-like cysteine proteinase
MVATLLSKTLGVNSRAAFIAAFAMNVTVMLPAIAGPEHLAHVPVSGHTAPPFGWVDFCVREPGECPASDTAPRNVTLSAEAWATLVRVNRIVNEAIKPLTDWGVVERWSYPDDGYGDCEDYALLKRRTLIQSGWPRQSLLLTVVGDNKDEGHAVLTIVTDKGDYVLDNQSNSILLWSETGYHFINRQSQSNSNTWVSLGHPQPAISTATSR